MQQLEYERRLWQVYCAQEENEEERAQFEQAEIPKYVKIAQKKQGEKTASAQKDAKWCFDLERTITYLQHRIELLNEEGRQRRAQSAEERLDRREKVRERNLVERAAEDNNNEGDDYDGDDDDYDDEIELKAREVEKKKARVARGKGEGIEEEEEEESGAEVLETYSKRRRKRLERRKQRQELRARGNHQ